MVAALADLAQRLMERRRIQGLEEVHREDSMAYRKKLW
jgi:hypothetical protein